MTTTETPINGHQVNGHARTSPDQHVTAKRVDIVELGKAASDPGADVGTSSGTSAAPPVASKRVQRWRDQLAEDQAIVEIQDEPALVNAHTDKVIKERRKASEAFRLHQLAADPARVALRDRRTRSTVGWVGGFGLVGALGWSTANVQATAAGTLTVADPGWWLSFLVEPVVSVVLLLIFGVRAYLAATKGITITDSRLRRIEIIGLAITLTCNSWKYLPLVAADFQFIQLLIHSIGPIVAVMLVTAIPLLWQYLTADWENEAGPAQSDQEEHCAIGRQLIATQALPPNPSRGQFERAARAELKRQGRRGINTLAAQRAWRSLNGKTGA
jgi:hypothetical protein